MLARQLDLLLQDRTILSLCDFTGEWSKPYREAGYQVIQIDLKHGHDVRLFRFPGNVHGVLAAPPCTDFAVSGARWWASKTDEQLKNSLAVVDACLRLVAVCNPVWWALENPVGRLNQWLGEPVMYFNPCEFGEPYTKKTALWGRFNTDLVKNPVEPVEGSKMWRLYGGKSERTKAARSITPPGFAQAFYQANP